MSQRTLTYKVVETSTVTDERIETILNEWSAQGWNFAEIKFAMREGSRRPAMAYLLFTREDEKSTTVDSALPIKALLD